MKNFQLNYTSDSTYYSAYDTRATVDTERGF